MVGRSDVVVTLADQLSRNRFITIVGPGGIGKTTVALAVANRVLRNFPDGVHFVDLASLTDPLLVPSTLAAQLGLGIHSERPLPGLIGFLKERSVLIVLDSCEHVIEAAATLAEAIISGTRRATISQPAGRHCGRKASMSTGSRRSPFHRKPKTSKPKIALSFPAVQLFVDRAAASLGSFELGNSEASLVAEICRRLDGIPLALQIAASRVDTFGVAGLAAGLNDRFQLLMQGRRTALPRHRTLSAALE